MGELSDGHLEAARKAGAHDEFITFVSEYPDSDVAETLETAISLDALDQFQSVAGSFDGALFKGGAKVASNPDTENAKKIRELFPENRWPTWMQQEYGVADE